MEPMIIPRYTMGQAVVEVNTPSSYREKNTSFPFRAATTSWKRAHRYFGSSRFSSFSGSPAVQPSILLS